MSVSAAAIYSHSMDTHAHFCIPQVAMHAYNRDAEWMQMPVCSSASRATTTLLTVILGDELLTIRCVNFVGKLEVWDANLGAASGS